MKSKSAKSAAKPHDLPILTYRLDVRCKLYGKYPTLKAATLAGLDTMWGTPWQIHIEAPGCLGDGHLIGWHDKFGTRERYLEYAATLTK